MNLSSKWISGSVFVALGLMVAGVSVQADGGSQSIAVGKPLPVSSPIPNPPILPILPRFPVMSQVTYSEDYCGHEKLRIYGKVAKLLYHKLQSKPISGSLSSKVKYLEKIGDSYDCRQVMVEVSPICKEGAACPDHIMIRQNYVCEMRIISAAGRVLDEKDPESLLCRKALGAN